MPTSPYLVREAKKLSIGAKANHRPGDYRFPRNQREAGIEHAEWEGRIKPMRSILFWLAVASCWAVPVTAAWVMVG